MSLHPSALCFQRRLLHLRWVLGPETTEGGGQGSGADPHWAGGGHV